MTQNDEWHKHLAEVVATEIKRHRKRRRMSAQRLSDATAELGAPIPRTVLSNFENGRRPTISLAELLVIARALEVPPILLIFPIGRVDRSEFLPGAQAEPWIAARWFSGEEDLEDVLPHKSGQEWHKDGRLPVELFRDHDHWSAQLVRAQANFLKAQQNLIAAEATGEDPNPAWLQENEYYDNIESGRSSRKQMVNLLRREVERTERSLQRVRDDMRAADLIPPKLWPDFAYLEGEPDGQ
ncbi:MAG TPA: helix-turn-helix transcriptional regulator [Amycolatopsis sp.]|uniref:helix-turn-helix domain-containing protein n=1 Tax=Amycolatopsis sp. TaxID=37632 RepID=UPI002B45F981|nr:helix-turn-helix transcriptional regulator [Amycolatopsis sp.]HKS47406.1 helix-turn-helix transcriptional regulator [Amycolatopsis sp.]